MYKVIFLIAIVYFSCVAISEAEELCGKEVCNGALSYCCRKGDAPRCILSEQSCTSNLCGNSPCSSSRSYCCKIEGYTPYCTTRSSYCIRGRCGTKLCKTSKPYCCNGKCSSSSVCEVTTTLTPATTIVPDGEKCGADVCSTDAPYCCHQGSTSFCTTSERSCQVLKSHKCGKRLCGQSKPYCCNSEVCTESEDECRSRQCGGTTCAQENAVCCRIGGLFTCVAKAENCESFSCDKDSCVGANSFCCNATSNNFCTSDPSNCFGGFTPVDQTTTSSTDKKFELVTTTSPVFTEKSKIVESRTTKTSTRLPEVVKTTSETTQRETRTSFKTEQVTDKPLENKTSRKVTTLSSGSTKTTKPTLTATTATSTKAGTLSQNTSMLLPTAATNDNLPETKSDLTTSAPRLQHTTPLQHLSTTIKHATIATSKSATTSKTAVPLNPKFTPKTEISTHGNDASKKENSSTETEEGDKEYLVDPEMTPKNNCGGVNCVAPNGLCCGTGEDTYCAQSCINQSGGSLSLQIWIPVLIVVCGLIVLVAFVWFHAAKLRKKFFPLKKNYPVTEKTNSHKLEKNPSVRADSYEYVANTEENGV